MPFDQPTRNLLQRTVSRCRDILAGRWDSPADGEFFKQLQEIYGISPDGTAAPLEVLEHLSDEDLETARVLREILDHYTSGLVATGKKQAEARREAVLRLAREQAFTVLNRLAALRMAEERGIVLECVRQGLQSEGFQLFQQSAGTALGSTPAAYRTYLFVLFDELSRDLGVLFNRFDKSSLLFPRHAALEAILRELNGTGAANKDAAFTPAQISALWAEDEAIGWIYQYYNDQAERKAMRDESAAPRNSRELAVRNQFFTPRYVVEFLTDNTLGRIWYEMTKGRTRLKEQCRYLVRRPTEIFLNPGEDAPSTPENSESNTQNPKSQEELLREPVHIPHRPLKDPRSILMLDPACGSMHFGLYAFDLFEVIYEEFWDLHAADPENFKLNPENSRADSLFSLYATKGDFLRDVPRLIIENNLHGIDIDPRCAQIAGLSLWLRAQKAWQRLGLAPAQRPAIKRSNIVCAEPMPGEKELLREFVEREFPAAERAVCLRLLEAIFDKMQLAGEAGSLLKIEEEIRCAIEDARDAWQKLATKPKELFTTSELNQLSTAPELTGLEEAVSSLTTGPRALTTGFWERIEERIYAALRDYAEQAENGGGFQRRLFAEDAARGFAFIDICKKRYDVALMNPPFGDASLPSKPYIEETYGDTKGDVYKAFVECFHARLVPAGYLGIISSRTGFFLGQSEDWRTRVVLRLFRPIALADLGSGVLDAMVEVAAYVLRSLSAPEARDLTHSIVPALGKVVRDSQDRFSLPKWQAARGGLKRHQAVAELEHLEAHGFVQRSSGDTVRYTPLWHLVKKVLVPPEPVYTPLVCVRALADDDKETILLDGIHRRAPARVFVCDPGAFLHVPSGVFAYWVSAAVHQLFTSLPQLEADGRIARQGGVNGSDFRYLRSFWEVLGAPTPRSQWSWKSIAKGGRFSRIYCDLELVICWDSERGTFAGFVGLPHRPLEKPASCGEYFRAGLTWPRRTNGLSIRILPHDCIFADKGPAFFVAGDNHDALLAYAALLNSSVFVGLVALQLARVELAQSFEVGLIQTTPVPDFGAEESKRLKTLALQCWGNLRGLDSIKSTTHAFLIPGLLAAHGNSLVERAGAWAARVRTSEEAGAAIQAEIDDLAFRLYGLDAADRAALTSTLATEATGEAEAGEDENTEAATADATALAADLLAYALGSSFGRWDIRYATGEQAAPELPDPFAPLPVCPPGQLQNAHGLPLGKEEVGRMKEEGIWNYPIEIPWDGIIVDDPNHPLDIERRAREVIEIIWNGKDGGPTAEAIEHEACEILGVKSLRDYFRKPTGFFADHLKRYSKSRRQAPIYWPLSTASGSYTLWIYYHRLTPDTLYKCLQQFVEPKIREIEQDLVRLRAMDEAGEGGRQTRDQLAKAETLRTELLALRDELAHWAPRWKPNLNDGVQITASPLWKLFLFPKWRKTLEQTWKELDRGDYDWAHLAHTLHPARVREKCKTDRSLAIAHSLEDLCQIQAPAPKKKRGKKAQAEEELI
jgi:hypothetical protein